MSIKRDSKPTEAKRLLALNFGRSVPLRHFLYSRRDSGRSNKLQVGALTFSFSSYLREANRVESPGRRKLSSFALALVVTKSAAPRR